MATPKLQSRADIGASFNATNSWLAPAFDAEAISYTSGVYTPPTIARGFYVGTQGDVQIVTLAGTTVIIPGCVAGVEHSIAFIALLNASTTATNIVALG
jgi:hypothetical protein